MGLHAGRKETMAGVTNLEAPTLSRDLRRSLVQWGESRISLDLRLDRAL